MWLPAGGGLGGEWIGREEGKSTGTNRRQKSDGESRGKKSTRVENIRQPGRDRVERRKIVEQVQ